MKTKSSTPTLIFNQLRDSGTAWPATVVRYTSDPAVALQEQLEVRRHAAQVGAGLPSLPNDPDLTDIFGDDPCWAYRIYRQVALWKQEQTDDPIGTAVPRPLSKDHTKSVDAQRKALGSLALDSQQITLPLAAGTTAFSLAEGNQYLYLFNVLVAFEWQPSAAYLETLKWAFRRASDALYDITNGSMAFGQVIFGGPDLLPQADIQIMASNRLLPRSWVGGLVYPEKYVPIRVGRGIWVRRRYGTIAWEEPEGYRALVHEWCHYALGFKDEYIARVAAALRSPSGTSSQATLVVPQARVTSTSIMATAEGNSELDDPLAFAGPYQETLVAFLNTHYPGIRTSLAQPRSGPNQLPLPLPGFRSIGALAMAESEHFRFELPYMASITQNQQPLIAPLGGIPEEGWNLFVVHPGQNGYPARVVAQGQVDADAYAPSPMDLTRANGFLLYGTTGSDAARLVLINRSGDVWECPVNSPGGWVPLASYKGKLAVIPETVASGSMSGGPPPVNLRVRSGGTGATIYPLNGLGATAVPATLNGTLDGIVLVQQNAALTYASYSYGGGPATAPNVIYDPVAAGASDGDALLFFYSSTGSYPQAASLRIVTTALSAVNGSVEAGYAARGAVYAVASNEALPTNMDATLSMTCRSVDFSAGERLFIGRLDGASWTILPSYQHPSMPLAAISLESEGRSLFSQNTSGADRVEYFCLFVKK